MTLYIPIGPPACGKSSLGFDLIEQGVIPAEAVVSTDHFRRVLTGSESDLSQDGRVFRIVDDIIRGRLESRLDVYVDATNLGTRSHWLADVARATGNTSVAIVFDVSTRELLRRNDLRERKVPTEVIYRMVEQVATVQNDQPLVSTWVREPDFRMSMARLSA